MATLLLSFEPRGFLLAEGLGSSADNEARAIVVDVSGPLRTLMQLRMGEERREALFAGLSAKYDADFEVLEQGDGYWLGHADFANMAAVMELPLYRALAQFGPQIKRAYVSFQQGTATMRIETDMEKEALESIAAMLDALPNRSAAHLSARVMGEPNLSPQWKPLLPHLGGR